VLGFLIGYLLQDILMSLYIFTVGVVLTALLVIPAWPHFNKDPIKWLPSRAKAAAAAAAAEAEASKK
ncbi:hypothetical protein BGZ65_006270, partial [Modicella reniformis]